MYIIGVVGPFGSGCSYVSDILSKKYNCELISLSTILRDLYKQEKGDTELERSELQDFGNKIRNEKALTYLAEKAWERICENTNKNYIIDSIRNPSEIEFFKRNHTEFYLLGVFADKVTRWERVKGKYKNNLADFERDDERDSGEKYDYGQKVTDCFRMSDAIVLNEKTLIEGNEDFEEFVKKIERYMDIIEKKSQYSPFPVETYMAMAYAVSMRSSCLKRKVGALIVDDIGNVFSSGYNEVPVTQRSCKKEVGICYRDKLKEDFASDLEGKIASEEERMKALDAFNSSFKILDYCRALHAEENAILNVARVGASSALRTAILYTTTYPCTMCANKIVQVGIENMVYLEPYPMKEAKKVLDQNKVTQTPFEGVTYNGYFRFMEVLK